MNIWNLFGFISLVVFTNCNTSRNYEINKEAIYNLYSGKHELRKMFNNTEKETTSGKMSGFLFFVIGSIESSSGKSKTTKLVTFSWKNNNHEYMISKLPITNVRIKFKQKINTPYVTFNWDKGIVRYLKLKEVNLNPMKYVIYMTIHCKEEHWPKEINMPDLSDNLN